MKYPVIFIETQISKFMFFLLLFKKKKKIILYKILLFVLENVTREQLLLLQGIIKNLSSFTSHKKTMQFCYSVIP